MKELMIKISRCEEIKKAFNDTNHPCHSIIQFQNNNLELLQHPEPWNGNIEEVLILFVSSNPSYNAR